VSRSILFAARVRLKATVLSIIQHGIKDLLKTAGCSGVHAQNEIRQGKNNDGEQQHRP